MKLSRHSNSIPSTSPSSHGTAVRQGLSASGCPSLSTFAAWVLAALLATVASGPVRADPYEALSTTAMGITGDIDLDDFGIVFENGERLYFSDLVSDEIEVDGVAKPASVYRIAEPANPGLNGGNTLCGEKMLPISPTGWTTTARPSGSPSSRTARRRRRPMVSARPSPTSRRAERRLQSARRRADIGRFSWDPAKASARRALGEDALQRAAVHVEAPRRLRHVAVAQLVDALDVLPAHAVGRHRVLRRLGALVPVLRISAALISSASAGLAR